MALSAGNLRPALFFYLDGCNSLHPSGLTQAGFSWPSSSSIPASLGAEGVNVGGAGAHQEHDLETA